MNQQFALIVFDRHLLGFHNNLAAALDGYKLRANFHIYLSKLYYRKLIQSEL